MTFGRVSILGCVLLVAAFAIPVRLSAAGEESASGSDGRTIGVGDIVSFEVLEDKGAPVPKRVSDTGDLDVVGIGRVHVAGMTCDAAASTVSKLLVKQDLYYTATVRIAIDQVSNGANGKPATVYVSGAVKLVGAETILAGGSLTVSQAIVKAGGGTQVANLSKVKLIRKNKDGSKAVFEIDVNAVLEGKPDKDRDLQDGDLISVPKKLINFN